MDRHSRGYSFCGICSNSGSDYDYFTWDKFVVHGANQHWDPNLRKEYGMVGQHIRWLRIRVWYRYSGWRDTVSILRGFRGRFLWLGALGSVMGVAMAGIGFIHVPWGGIALMGIMGITVSVVNIPFITYIQTIVPSDKLGRTMSLLTLMSIGLVPVSYTASSFVLQQHQIGVPELLLWCGLATALLFGAMYFFRDFRQVESHPLWQVKVADNTDHIARC